MKILLRLGFLVLFVSTLCINAKAASSDVTQLVNMPMEDLMNTPVSSTAMLTKSSNAAYIPASITTITEEQIAMTPARNIYDLMEIYVPGAIWATHSEGPHIGIRGIISDRNNKIIIVVNGRRLNENAHSGAEDELEQWDLNDIKKIEIIRGPGSVTYGPGAIEGVISITTKNAMDAPGTRAGVSYVEKYDSKAAYISEGVVKKNYNYYTYASIVGTKGYSPREFFTTASGSTGYLGKSTGLGTSRGDRLPLDYFNDADDKPQVKVYTEFNWAEELKAWARYTNFGTSEHGTLLNTQAIMSDGSQIDLKENMTQSAEAALEDKHVFNEDLNLDTMVSWSSIDHIRRENPAGTNVAADGTDVDSMQNTLQEFSETGLLTKSLLNYTLAEKYKFAVGFENLYSHYGPAWGGSNRDFRMGDSANIFGSLSTAAVALNSSIPNVQPITSAYVVPGGWWDDTISYLSEANLAFDPKFNLILSGRTDENSYTKLMFSPRVAIVSDWQRMGITKFIWQKSVRMNTAEQLFLTDKTGGKNNPETLKGWEFDYDVNPTQKLSLATALYYNSLDDYGWSSTALSEVPLGKLNVGGVEFEPTYKVNEKLTVGGSQSFTKQISFKLGSGQTRSGLSYASYNVPVGGETLSSTGNDLDNLPNYATKIFADYKVTSKWTLHTDARVFWGFQGDLDGLKMLHNAAAGTANQAAVDQAIDNIKAAGAYRPDARLDLAARYEVNKNVSITLMVSNLVGFNGNKRYSYEAGVNTIYPNRATWIDEPRVYALKVDCKF